MIKTQIARRVFKLAFSCLVFATCSKDPFPSTINLVLGKSAIFDATEDQIIKVDDNNLKLEVEIVSIDNTLCPEGSRCVSMGSAIIGFKLINNFHELITLSFPNNDVISDSVNFSINNQEYYIKLSNVRKVFTNERKTKTKSIIELKIDSI